MQTTQHPITKLSFWQWQSIAAVLLLIVGPLAGILVIQAPQVGMIGLAGIFVVLVMMNITTPTAMRGVALAVCAFIITYPMFLPRRDTGELSVAAGGEFDARAQIELVFVLLIAAIAFWVWLSSRRSVAILTAPPLNQFAVYSALIVVSLSYTPDIWWAGWAALRWFEAMLLLASLGVLVQTTAQLKRMVDVVMWACALLLLAFVIDGLTGSVTYDFSARIHTTWLHPNNASVVAFTLTSLALTRFLTSSRWRDTLISGGLAFFGLSAGFLSGGKTGVIGSAIALVCTLAVIFYKGVQNAMLGRLLLVALGVGLAVTMFVVTNMGIVAHLEAYQTESQYLDPSNLTGRVPLWSAAMKTAMEAPILGHGYMSTFALPIDNGDGWISKQAHNTFVQTFFDLGLLGIVILVWIYVSVWRSCLHQVFRGGFVDESWRLSLELFAALIGLTINSFTEDTFSGIFEVRTMLFVLVIFAIYQNVRVSQWRAAERKALPQPTAPEG